MNTDEILDYAIDMREQARKTDPRMFEWRTPLRTLVQSGVFTTPQAAAILRVSKQYAQRYMKEIEGPANTGKRTRGGVSGKLDPESLDRIKLLRALWTSREAETEPNKRGRAKPIGETERELIAAILSDGANGVRMISYLTTVPVQTLYRVRKEEGEEA